MFRSPHFEPTKFPAPLILRIFLSSTPKTKDHVPEGILIDSVTRSDVWPFPLQSSQVCCCFPVPRHCSQVLEKIKPDLNELSDPEPEHVLHTFLGSFFEPLPLHVEHCFILENVSSLLAPFTESMKSISKSSYQNQERYTSTSLLN
jgi:hypothetical protein